MANRQNTRAHRAHGPQTTEHPRDLTQASPYPQSVGEKITCARGIVVATMATLDGEPVENFDPHWTLSVAVALLDQAFAQMDRGELAQAGAT